MVKQSLLLLVVVAGVALLLWLSIWNRPTTTTVPAQMAVREHPVAATPAPRIVPLTPTPKPPVIRHATVVLPWNAEPTPSPTEPEPTEPPSAAPEPAAPPAVEQCVAIRWSAGMSPATIAQVLVEVDAANRCGRDLDPLEVWFEIAGYRHGDLVQSVRGHFFDPLPKDGEGTATIALPGSADWYDEIRVAVLPAGAR